MEKTSFSYKVLTNIKLTEADVNHIASCSSTHYDGKCQSASKPGGFIYGWMNNMQWTKEDSKGKDTVIEVTIDFNQADTVTKILEQERYEENGVPQFFNWKRLLIEMNEETFKVNAHNL